MNFDEIADRAEIDRKQQLSVVDPSMSNYRGVLKEYKGIMNDMLVMLRESAERCADLERRVVTLEAMLLLTTKVINEEIAP